MQSSLPYGEQVVRRTDGQLRGLPPQYWRFTASFNQELYSGSSKVRIREGELEQNPELIKRWKRTKEEGKALHLFTWCLMAEYIPPPPPACLQILPVKRAEKIYIHAFTRYHDTDPKRDRFPAGGAGTHRRHYGSVGIRH